MFKGYNQDQMEKIAIKLGHSGDISTFDQYLNSNPQARGKYDRINEAISQRYAEGGVVATPDPVNMTDLAAAGSTDALGDAAVARVEAPGLAGGATTTAVGTDVTSGQLLDTTTGQVSTTPTDVSAATAETATADVAPITEAAAVTNVTSTPAVEQALDATQAAQGTVTALMAGATQDPTTTEVKGIDAAQTDAVQIDGAPTRTLEGGELVAPVANAQQAAAFTEEIKAAQADPSSKATVQGQLATLMTSFEDGKTPAWAAGAMRNVTQQMAARGIGSSSMAGQALIQAALEASLPIATSDAQTYASFEMTNLNNKQQRSMLAAQQRAEFMGQEFDQGFQSRVLNANKVSDVANMNFTAEQQVAIENANLANTTNLANLSNRQALVMAEAAQISQLETTNLTNRQQAQIQNAQAFLDMDMANLTNEQQTTMFKAQERISSLMSDTAAENAARQFNATSQQQTDQFFANMQKDVNTFNAAQKNAQNQFNAGETTSIEKFNSEMDNQREQFNAQNRLVIDQSNAQWRREVATAETVAVNRANEINAKAILDISNSAYNDLWQANRDDMDWAYQMAEGEADRINALARATLQADAEIRKQGMANDSSSISSIFSLFGTLAGLG